MPRRRPGGRWRSACSPSGASAASSRAASRSARAATPSSSTRALRRRTAGRAPTTCCRGCSRTSSRASRPCAGGSWTAAEAGTATACPWSSRWRSGSASRASPRSRRTASPSSTPCAASRCSRTWTSGSGSPSASASGSTPIGPTARWTPATSRASGGAWPSSTSAACCIAATRSCPTAHGAARRSRATRWPSATRTWTIRPRSCASRCATARDPSWSGPRRRGRCRPTRPPRSTPA